MTIIPHAKLLTKQLLQKKSPLFALKHNSNKIKVHICNCSLIKKSSDMWKPILLFINYTQFLFLCKLGIFCRAKPSIMKLWLSIIIVQPYWLTCKKNLLGGHDKARRTVTCKFEIHHVLFYLHIMDINQLFLILFENFVSYG